VHLLCLRSLPQPRTRETGGLVLDASLRLSYPPRDLDPPTVRHDGRDDVASLSNSQGKRLPHIPLLFPNPAKPSLILLRKSTQQFCNHACTIFDYHRTYVVWRRSFFPRQDPYLTRRNHRRIIFTPIECCNPRRIRARAILSTLVHVADESTLHGRIARRSSRRTLSRGSAHRPTRYRGKWHL